MTTPLATILQDRIAATGPITVAEFMAECLMHPEYGYYSTRDPFGTSGDFTTAPEISQMFGELVGLAIAQAWIDQGRPSPICLAELGPGRGTMMADLLRATRIVPGFHAAAQLHLVETSPALRQIQGDHLTGVDPVWLSRVEDLPDLPLSLVANEFFDALPIRQFQRVKEGWRERWIGLQDGALAFGMGGPIDLPELARRFSGTPDGRIVELCAPAGAVMAEIATRISDRGGAAIVIDYGDWHSQGDTLQAVQAHAPADLLAQPGAADLTAHVDFEALADAAKRAAPHVSISAMTPQGEFLAHLGIAERAQALAAKLEGAALEAHIAAHHRLTRPDEMGTVFKVMALTPEGAAPVAGLRK